MSEKIKDYKDLKIWQQAMDIVVEVYRLTSTFPPEERFGLTFQMRKSAVSIASQIPEGSARRSNREYTQFLYISLGSCAELETQTLIAGRLGYMSQQDVSRLVEKLGSQSRMTMSLIQKITSD
jgi:four helix bundle protein